MYIAGLGTDGAASMVGCHSGLTVKMKEVCPQLIPVHCVAHRLQLAVLDVCRSIEYVQNFDRTITEIYKFYHGSAKRLHNLKETANVLKEDIRKLGDVNDVRWLASRTNALKALVSSWKAIVTQLEQSVANKDSDSAKAKGLLKSLKTFQFVKVLHFLLDVFSKLKVLSVALQDKQLMISSLKEKTKYTILILEKLEKESGENESAFISEVTLAGVFKDVKLMNVDLGERNFQSLRGKVIQNAKTYLEERLASVSTDIVSLFHVFDSALWPNKAGILNFGNEEIKKLAMYIFDKNVNNDEKIEVLLAEWCEYKLSFATITFTEALLKMHIHKERFTNLFELVSFCAVIPVTTASCERGFSYHNRIKTAYRNALKTETMNNLLLCAVNGPTLNDFNPNKAIDLWYYSAKRQRYV